jgi:mono/diheme cytochrome c family protein
MAAAAHTLGNIMHRLILISVVLLAAACSEPGPSAVPVDGRWYTADQVDQGRGLYALHCSVCHAADGSATADWRALDANGNYPPPPLNGTAHTWHHPLDLLDDTLANGGAQFGGVMPGFAGVMDGSERLATVAWFQSLWSDEIYRKWQEIDSRSR